MSKFEKRFLIRKIKVTAAVLMSLVLAVIFIISSSGAYEKKEDDVYLPVIMYHSFLKEPSLQNDYVISPDVLEADLKYFNENAYTTITVDDLIKYVYNGKSLPPKCVMLTFDDGYYNNYEYAYPLLKKYNARAVLAPIASQSEIYTNTDEISVSYGYCSADILKEMSESEIIEIQNHTYDMHNLQPRKGILRKNNESTEEYKNALTGDIEKSQNFFKEKVGVNPVCFVYPYGFTSSESLNIIKENGFLCTMTVLEKPNLISRNPESLFELGRYRRDKDETTAELMARISKGV